MTGLDLFLYFLGSLLMGAGLAWSLASHRDDGRVERTAVLLFASGATSEVLIWLPRWLWLAACHASAQYRHTTRRPPMCSVAPPCRYSRHRLRSSHTTAAAPIAAPRSTAISADGSISPPPIGHLRRQPLRACPVD